MTIIQQSSDTIIFICYAKEDFHSAKKLYHDLKIVGFSPWIDTEDLKPGQKWKHVILEMMEKSSYVLILLSNYSIQKHGFVQREIKEAINLLDIYPSSSIFVIPVRLEDCDPPVELKEFHWVDLFPDYEAGLQKLVSSFEPEGKSNNVYKFGKVDSFELKLPLRSTPLITSEIDALNVFKIDKIPGKPVYRIENDYKGKGDVVIDHATGLMWQKAGSNKQLSYSQAIKYIEELNTQRFAGFVGWRMATIQELISLLEPIKQTSGLYINTIFDKAQRWCWSSDQLPKNEKRDSLTAAWLVSFLHGDVGWHYFITKLRIRAVRSLKDTY
jgi:hypothetical protein